MRAVIDTNILVSGLIRPRGAPGAVLCALRDRRFLAVVSPAILDEIIGGLDCRYNVSIDDQDLAQVDVRLDDGLRIVRDVGNGWTYDSTTQVLEFHGESCDYMRDRGATLSLSLRCE